MERTDTSPMAPSEIAKLHEAFERFSRSSEKLEERYQALLAETVELRERLRVKDIELKRSERLAMLGETAAAIAHEVRNPLGAIKLFVSLLRKDVADRPDALETIRQIDTSISSLDNVVSNILQFSKDRTLSMAPINVVSLIREQLHSFPRSPQNQVAVTLSCEGNPFIVGNADGLRQVFYNLLLNAHQALKYRGRIDIAVRDCEEGIEVTVSDDGPGVASAILERLFEPFVTTRNEGTGLGLAIVKKIVLAHRGTIEVTQRGGAVFTVTLPRAQEGGK